MKDRILTVYAQSESAPAEKKRQSDENGCSLAKRIASESLLARANLSLATARPVVTHRLANGIFLTSTRKSLYLLPTLAAGYSTRVSRTPSAFGPSHLFYLFVETSRYVTTPNRAVTCTVTHSTVVTPRYLPVTITHIFDCCYAPVTCP